MHLTIVSQDKNFFEGKVDYVELPGSMGRFQVLHNHMPLISTLINGVIVYKYNEKKYKLPATAGIAKVLDNKVSVLLEND